MDRQLNFLNHRPFKARNGLYIKTGIIFLAVGLAGLILPFISFGVSDDYKLLEAIAESQSFPLEGDINIPSAGFDPNMTDVKSRLVIPGINIDMPLFESSDSDVLYKGGWVFPGTARPGQKGNSVIFGHRFRYLPPITNTFFSLDKVQIGDIFTVVWNGWAYKYKVKEKKIVEANDFSVLNQGDGHEMTLITCTPLFSTKQRLVVVASLEE